jgi:hypothetical protein
LVEAGDAIVRDRRKCCGKRCCGMAYYTVPGIVLDREVSDLGCQQLTRQLKPSGAAAAARAG